MRCRNCGSLMRRCCLYGSCARRVCRQCGTVFDWLCQLWVDYSRRRPPLMPTVDAKGRVR